VGERSARLPVRRPPVHGGGGLVGRPTDARHESDRSRDQRRKGEDRRPGHQRAADPDPQQVADGGGGAGGSSRVDRRGCLPARLRACGGAVPRRRDPDRRRKGGHAVRSAPDRGRSGARVDDARGGDRATTTTAAAGAGAPSARRSPGDQRRQWCCGYESRTARLARGGAARRGRQRQCAAVAATPHPGGAVPRRR